VILSKKTKTEAVPLNAIDDTPTQHIIDDKRYYQKV
jgi:hypothetical protein